MQSSHQTNHIDTHWFKDRIADKRLSQRKLASLMGLDPGALSLALNGKRKMSAAEASDIARLLDVDVTEVLTHAGVNGHGNQCAQVNVGAMKAQAAAPVTSVSGDWEAEFMRKWLDLGLHLLRNRGP